MKILIALLLSLLLTACSAPPAQEEQVPPEAPVEQELPLEQPAPPQEQTIHYEAETTLFADTLYAEDGTQLLHYAVHIPYLSAWREDGTEITEAQNEPEEKALAAVQTFNDRFAVWHSDEAIREAAEAASMDLAWYQEEQMDWYGGYWMELNCTVYQTEHLISISGVYSARTGGAHPNTYLLGWNFDPHSGQFFGAERLAGYTEMQEAVASEIIRQAQERAAEYELAPEEFFWPEYESIIADWPSYAISFDENGMKVAFSPYELAAYAVGVQEFILPYDFLADYLDEPAQIILGLTTE